MSPSMQPDHQQDKAVVRSLSSELNVILFFVYIQEDKFFRVRC